MSTGSIKSAVMKKAYLAGMAATVVAATSILNPALASAQSTAALTQCHAKKTSTTTAAVPGDHQDDYFTSVDGKYTTEEMLCGNGTNYGAVHIELKHKVYNWDVADECLWNIANMYQTFDGGSKRTYTFKWGRSGHSAKMVAGNNGIITAYPWDSGSRDSWEECADQ